MSTTFKLLLDKRRPTSKGTFPIRLRIYQGTDYRDYSPGVSILPESWDQQREVISNNHPEAKHLNSKINSSKIKLSKILHLHELNETPEPTLSELICLLKEDNTLSQKPDLTTSIIEYGKARAAKLKKAGKIGNSIIYLTAINKLLKHVKRTDFSFGELTISVLDNWETQMLADGLKTNSIANYMRTIRAIYNKAIDENVASAADYPFARFNVKHEKTISRNLSLEEMQLIHSVDLPEAYLIAYRNLFLLSFCLIGINFGDMLTIQRQDIIDGRLVFHRRKTHKIYSIKLNPKAQELLELLGSNNQGHYLMPFIPNRLSPEELKKKIALIVHCVNEAMKKIAKCCSIQKRVTTYYARYAWANIAKRNCGYSKDMIAEALGHEYGNRVTGIYLDEYGSDLIDDMNTAVISAVFNLNKKG